MPHTQFEGKKLLAIDFGSQVIGLAQFHVGRDPFPYPAGRIVVKSEAQVIKQIIDHIDDEVIDIIILGLPHLTDGTATEMTEKVRAFGTQLKATIGELPLYLQDETLSSYEAEQRMKNSPRYNFKVDRRQIDAVAATIILEDFLTSETFCIL